MYVKEDIILPHAVTFYDLIRARARGRTGPLFHFDVHEDMRVQHDARVENDESHAGEPAPRPDPVSGWPGLRRPVGADHASGAICVDNGRSPLHPIRMLTLRSPEGLHCRTMHSSHAT